MTPSVPIVSGAEVIRVLGQIGFHQVGQRGSHVKLRDSTNRTVIVPLHKELARGTLAAVLRQAGITTSDLLKLL